MKRNDPNYSKYALCNEMLETPAVISNFKLDNAEKVIDAIKATGKLFLTGEGSSRIFPAKNVISFALEKGLDVVINTEGSRQAAEYKIDDYAVFGASNSGSTKEIIVLLDKLKKAGSDKLFGLTAREGTTLAEYANQTFVLKCGWENAVAATKSVAEQALFYQELIAQFAGKSISSELEDLADAVEKSLTLQIPQDIIDAIADAGTIYFAGRNNGVAEELTLKTNEITRKKSDYLEGTYAVHGIEEVMNADDIVILIDPFEEEQEKFAEVLVKGVGLQVFAISDKETIFPTIKVPFVSDLQNFVYLAAGWNILVEVGITLGIDLDKPERARKVGNEFVAE